MNLKAMLPFLDEEELSSLAKKLAASPDGTYQGVTLTALLPFLEEEDVDTLMVALYKKGQDIKKCLPFASDDGLSALLASALEDGAPSLDFKKLLPFLEEDDLKKLAERLIAAGGKYQNLSFEDLLPFVEEEEVDQAFAQKLRTNDPALKSYLPFVSEKAFHAATDAYCAGKISDEAFDLVYPFLDEKDLHRVFEKALNS
jgi:hypothetical protein